MKLTKKEEHLLKSLPEATPVLRGKDAVKFINDFVRNNRIMEKKLQEQEKHFKLWLTGSFPIFNPNTATKNAMWYAFREGVKYGKRAE